MLKWLDQLKSTNKITTDYDGKRTVQYHFEDGSQLEEEYNLELNVVLRRAWKKKGQTNNDWQVEIGEPEVNEDFSTIFIKENPSQPYIRKRNTRRIIEWRIRNLPFTSDTYIVTCKENEREIIVKTTNRKYFKTLKIPELEKLDLPFSEKNLSYKYNKQVLVIQYIKPPEFIQFEKDLLQMVKELTPKSNISDADEGSDEPVLKKRKIEEL